MASKIAVRQAADENLNLRLVIDGTQNIVPSAARTTTTNHSAFDVSLLRGSVVGIDPDVTAVSGTGPTLDLAVQQSNDGVTWFETQDVLGDAFTQVTAVTNPALKNFLVVANLFRIRAVIAGTSPSFTYIVDLKAAA